MSRTREPRLDVSQILVLAAVSLAGAVLQAAFGFG
jgi:hypothetical protein